MKMAGLLLIVLCCSMTGTLMGSSLWDRVRKLENCDALLGEMIHRMRHLSPTTGGLIASLAAQERFERLGFLSRCRDLMAAGKQMPDAWRGSLEGSGSLLGRQEAALLGDLADVLGRTDLESQLDALQCTRELLAQRTGEAREKAGRLSGLYRTMGMLCGAALFIVLV